MQPIRLLYAISLVCGTCVGASMLALPVLLAGRSYLQCFGQLLIAWSVMSVGAYVYLEVYLFEPKAKGRNYFSMASQAFGHWGEVVSGFLYVTLSYLLITAYFIATPSIILSSMGAYLGSGMLEFKLVIAITFALIMLGGIDWINRVNNFFVLLMIASFIALCFFVLSTPSHYQEGQATLEDVPGYFNGLGVIIVSFGYHLVIPSIAEYLNNHKRSLLICLLVGSLLPLALYGIWIYFIFETVPLGNLLEAHKLQISAAEALLLGKSHSPWIAPLATAFSIGAIVSSLLGAGVAFKDFLLDAISTKFPHFDHAQGVAFSVLACTLPPLLASILMPHLFISVLNFTGLFVALALVVILPIGMLWVGRYRQNKAAGFRMPGGRVLLTATVLFCLIIMVANIF